MFCVKCGTALADGQKFCHKCGAPSGEPQKKSPVFETGTPHNETALGAENISPASDVSVEFCAEKKSASAGKQSKPKALTVVLTVFLTLVLFIVSVAAVSVYSVRSTLNEHGMEAVFQQIDVVDVMKQLDSDTESNIDILCEEFNEEFNADITKEDIESFISKSTVKDFAADKISAFCEDVLKNEKNAELTVSQKEIYDLLRENSELIDKEFDVKLDKETLKDISGWFFEETELKIINAEELKDESAGLIDAATVVFSYVTMIILIVVGVILIGLMMINSFPQALLGAGINFAVIGGVTGLAALLKIWLPLSVFETAVGEFIGSVFVINAPLSIVCLALGTVLITVAAFLRKRAKA